MLREKYDVFFAGAGMTDSSVVTSAAHRAALGGGGVMTLNVTDANNLRQSYMSFVKNGGIYIPTPKRYDLGNEVFVLIKFWEENEKLPVMGTVIWINRASSVSKPPGIGVQFMDTPENAIARNRIETLIAGIPENNPTYTM